jgi:hypothetical protein
MPLSMRPSAQAMNVNAYEWIETRHLTYNLFRNVERAELLCAVPVDRPVPPFLRAREWSFEQSLEPSDVKPMGFRPRAAWDGTAVNGFYLFQTAESHRIRALHGSKAGEEANGE